MEISPLLRHVIRHTQMDAIRAKGFAADPGRYGYATAKLFAELEERNRSASQDVRDDIDLTRHLVTQLGPFQNPVHLFALVRSNRDVLTTARRLGFADDESWVPFASATFGHVNAVTKLVRRSYVVIYNDGLFTLAETFGRAVAVLLSDFEDRVIAGEHPGRIQATETATTRDIVETVISYVTTGDPRVRAMRTPERRTTVGDFYRDAIVTFVVAHELGHVYLHHLEQSPELRASLRTTSVAYRWQQELDADLFATRVLFASLLGPDATDPRHAVIGIQLFLAMEALTRAAADYLRHGVIPRVPDGEGTHPPPDRRFADVRSCLHRLAHGRPDLDPDDFLRAHVLVDLMVWNLLPPLRAECLRLRETA